MAAANILTTDVTAANSADIAIAATTLVGLKGAVKDCVVAVFAKDDTAAYNLIGSLTFAKPTMTIIAPGTYRFSRIAGPACGVYSA